MVVKDKVGRRRYIAFKLICGEKVEKGDLVRVVRKLATKRNLLTQMKPWLLRYKHNKGLLRCSHRFKKDAIGLLRDIKVINDRKVVIRTLGTSGTIKSAYTKYLKE